MKIEKITDKVFWYFVGAILCGGLAIKFASEVIKKNSVGDYSFNIYSITFTGYEALIMSVMFIILSFTGCIYCVLGVLSGIKGS